MNNFDFIGKIDTTGERALWQSVIMQAAIDILNIPPTMNERMERARTIAWFSLDNEDFLFVCSLAELNPHEILKGIRVTIKKSKLKQKRKRAKVLLQKKQIAKQVNSLKTA